MQSIASDFHAGLRCEASGKSKVIPILHSQTHVTLLDSLCLQVTLKQKFQTPEEEKVEGTACFYFPLPAKAAVHRFEAKLESGAILKGIVKEKSQARQEYKNALEQQFSALLMEQRDGDVFQCSIGCLRPREICEVTLSFVMEVEVTPHDVAKGGIRFTLPQDIAPRYDATYPEVGAPYAIQIVLDAHCSSDITHIEVPETYEPFLTTTVNGKQAMAIVDIKPTSSILDGFVGLPGAVEFFIKQESVPLISAMVERSLEHQSEVLRISFDENYSKSYSEREGLQPSPVELTFLVDRSGSMSGLNLHMLKDAMAVFLRSLPSNCLLQLVEFQSNWSKCFESGAQANGQQTLDTAEAWINSLTAMGGTNIRDPLRAVLQSQLDSKYKRHVIVLTDGDVGNVDDIVRLVRNHPEAAVHTLGLGPSFSEGLCLKVAEAGHGVFEPARNPKDLSSACIRIVRSVGLPSLSNVQFDLGNWNADNDAEMYPKDFRLIPGKRSNVYFVKNISAEGAKEKAPIDHFDIRVTAQVWDGDSDYRNVELNSLKANASPIPMEGLKDINKSAGILLHQLMAKSRIDSGEENITALAIRFNLASPSTSFLAIYYKEGKKAISENTRRIDIGNTELNDRFMQLNQQLNTTKLIMYQNIDQVLNRGENLDMLMCQSECLADASYEFMNQASECSQPSLIGTIVSLPFIVIGTALYATYSGTSNFFNWMGTSISSFYRVDDTTGIGSKQVRESAEDVVKKLQDSQHMRKKKNISETNSHSTFTELIRCQKFEGNFEMKLATFPKYNDVVEQLKGYGMAMDVLCTILALHVLHVEYMNQQQEWELVAEKAIRYLQTKMIGKSILQNIEQPALWQKNDVK